MLQACDNLKTGVTRGSLVWGASVAALCPVVWVPLEDVSLSALLSGAPGVAALSARVLPLLLVCVAFVSFVWVSSLVVSSEDLITWLRKLLAAVLAVVVQQGLRAALSSLVCNVGAFTGDQSVTWLTWLTWTKDHLVPAAAKRAYLTLPNTLNSVALEKTVIGSSGLESCVNADD